MRKWILILSAIVISMAFAGCSKQAGSELADCFEKDTLIEAAKEAITLAESDNYEGYAALFDDALSSQITEESYQSQYLDVIKEKGTFESFGDPVVIGQTDESTGKNYAGVILVAKYSDGKIQYSLGYNEEMRLIQFFIK